MRRCQNSQSAAKSRSGKAAPAIIGRRFKTRLPVSRSRIEHVELGKPGAEALSRMLGRFRVIGTLEKVKDFVAIIDAGAELLRPRKGERIVAIADHLSADEPQLRIEYEIDSHAGPTADLPVGSAK
jgi:hypothetical protein